MVLAGFDPHQGSLPKWASEIADACADFEEGIFKALCATYLPAIEALKDKIAAIKPNSAFFEQYGIGGMRALREICMLGRASGVPVILDAKRGDIGSTAGAYAAAALGAAGIGTRSCAFLDCDAVTVNPYLGFDTMEPFLKECRERGKGIFVLVQTSNPGARDLQHLQTAPNDLTVAAQVAAWVAAKAPSLTGSCGLSSLGAVVGATYPHEAAALRKLMPSSYFLIPGFGAQGGSAAQAVAGFAVQGSGRKVGGIVNVSRGLFDAAARSSSNQQEFVERLVGQAQSLNSELRAALGYFS